MKTFKAWAVLDHDKTIQTFGDESEVPVIVLTRIRAEVLSQRRVMKQRIVRVEVREVKPKRKARVSQ